MAQNVAAETLKRIDTGEVNGINREEMGNEGSNCIKKFCNNLSQLFNTPGYRTY
jgi:hypothetical protein